METECIASTTVISQYFTVEFLTVNIIPGLNKDFDNSDSLWISIVWFIFDKQKEGNRIIL